MAHGTSWDEAAHEVELPNGERILIDCIGSTGEVAVFNEGSVVILAE